MVAVGHLVHKYDEIICSIHQGGHPASHHDPPVGGPWWGSFAKTTGDQRIPNYHLVVVFEFAVTARQAMATGRINLQLDACALVAELSIFAT